LDQPQTRLIARATTTQWRSAALSAGTRLADLILGCLLLFVFWPVMLIVAIAVYLDSGVPIVYRCQRLGRYGRPITVLKFRSMRDGSHANLAETLSLDDERQLEFSANRKLRNDPRCTGLGRFLRRSSLDELPQLFNVISGDMSLIGPRPYFTDELRGRPETMDVLSVRPGMTGLWQVSGRSDLTFEERIALDVEYVRRRSFTLHAWIAISTLGAVLTGRGAY